MKQKRKTEIILETVEYYSTHPRSINPDYEDQVKELHAADESAIDVSKCMYKSPTGAECAFQRCVVTDLHPYENKPPTILMLPFNPEIENAGIPEGIKFKEGYEGHSSDFWNYIQSLHDTDANWDKDGSLSKYGERGCDWLLEKYKDN